MTSRRCAVLGSPIAHSLSPALHQAAYAYLGLAWTYGRYDVAEADLAAFVDLLDSSWRGLSLTMPLKAAALECVDEVDDVARLARAANTIIFESGRRRATNTDVSGLIAALRERGVGTGLDAAVLGAGATARSAILALDGIAETIDVYARSPSRAVDLYELAGTTGQQLRVRPWAERRDALAAEIVIATTPAGATDDLAMSVHSVRGTLLDVVYAPWPTRLAAAWSDAGGVVASGLDLLVHQAGHQVELMTGDAVPVDILRAALAPAHPAR